MNRPYFWVTRNCTFQNALIAGLLLTLAVFLGVLFFERFEAKVSEHLGLPEKSDILKFVGIAMGGILVALQALASYRRAKAMEDRTVSTEQGLRQERMKNAIEHLGHESDSVRIGGAYELLHLAKEAKPVGDDILLQQTVMDILCAHVRQTTSQEKYREEHKSNPSEEVQSLLTMLFVREDEVFKRLEINLSGSWLNGARLVCADLLEVNFAETYLEKANLSYAHLDGASLFCTRMQGAYLREATLNGAEFYQAQLQGADLSKTQFRGAVFLYSQMQGVNFTSAELQGVILLDVKLQGADLEHAQMHGVHCAYDTESSFPKRIRQAIGLKSDLTSVVFEGGISERDAASFVLRLESEDTDELREEAFEWQEKADEFRRKLAPHIGRPKSHELPKDSGAILA